MTDQRTDPPATADEITTLRGYLDFHRDTLRWKTSGLDAAELAQTLPPSTISLGGLLKHVALVESYWFSEIFLGKPLIAPFDTADWDADADWDWHSAVQDSPEELRVLLDRSIAASDEILEAAMADGGLDRVSAVVSKRTGEPWNLRWIVVHMIEEYARHNGHADLVRESIDGAVGE
ncbi:DinB family protein [Cellulosimicrobium sp. PMB13]|uniref:DinB family protein n=1 Tax=Cellulosimicrobium sp. PMB13 TaxID=3120158 RepID=UPI003F4CA80D